MTIDFDARIDGNTVRCRLRADRDIAGPTLCYSMMAPNHATQGGTRTRSVGGYSEVALPDLKAAVWHEVTLVHDNAEFTPANRAWLPIGANLRHADGPTTLAQPWARGVDHGIAPDTAPESLDGLRLVPPPSDWQASTGTADLTNGLASTHEAFAEVARIDARARLNPQPFCTPNGIPVSIQSDPAQPSEGYRLTVTAGEIIVAASDRAGIFYAAVTLRHLQITHDNLIPCGQITDAPRFSWRGQHLDCARHFYAPETLHDLLDLMALLKLNRFHWHFADDEAFRLEVDCLPDLWQKTAFRGEDLPIPGVFGGGVRSGGTYSKADAKALIAHAARLNIEVLPEIEVPAHALAMNAALPNLRDPADNGAEQSVQGYIGNTINPAMPRMWEVTTALATEVGALFPFAHLHLGCDELPDDTWSGSPAVTALKAREGLTTTDDVQGWTMDRIAAQVVANGQRPAAWEEAARGSNGGINNNAILFSWTGQGAGVDAARAGYDVVMCPAQNIYLDMAHSDGADDWGASWAAVVGLEDTVNWSPIPTEAPDIADRVLGIQSTYWSEFTTQDAQIWPMLMPRLLGVASKAWDKADSLDGPGLRRLADTYRHQMTGFWTWHHGA